MTDYNLLPEEERQKRLKALDALQEFSDIFTKAMQDIEDESEKYWNSLTKEQQLDVFCAVSRRIVKGELKDKGSYRYVLYDVFDFGPEAYAPAQMAGYMSIHNAIYDSQSSGKLIKSFCQQNNIEITDDQVDKFLETYLI